MELYAVTIVAFAGLSIVLTQAENMYYRACPSHYYYDTETEKCYGHYPDTALTWEKAREHCQSEGGDLIVTNEKSTSGYRFFQILNRYGIAPRLWLGLRDIATTGDTSEFRWIDDSPLEYKPWAMGHPSDRNPDTSICVERVYDEHSWWYFWKDVPCSEKIPFVCERQSDFYLTCPWKRAVSYHALKKCIKLRQKLSTWDAGREYCQDLGGDLVVIRDKTYNAFIKQRLLNNRACWIGFRNTTTTTGAHELKWVDGSSVDFYTDWQESQPDYERNGDNSIDAGDICGAFDNFRWENVSCDKKAKFIFCEQDFNEPLLCPGDDWTVNTRNRICYKIQTTEKMNFDDARALCQQEGGDLANIADAETKRILFDRIQPTIEEVYLFYVGLKIRNENRTFGWLDGSSFDESERASFSSESDEKCATFDFSHDKMRYQDEHCTRQFYFICHKNALRNYPLVECPHGYILSETKDSRVNCVIGQTKPKSWLAAVDDCSKIANELFLIKDPVLFSDQFLKTQLLSISINKVWSTNNSCEIYNYANSAFELKPCDEEYPYICQTWGNMTTTVVNMRNVVSLRLISDTDSVLPVGGNNDSALLVSDVCKASSLTELYTMYNWTMNSSSTVSILTGANFVQLVLENKNATCQVYEKEPCCVLVNLNSTNLQTEISFPMDQIVCACLPEDPLLYSETQSTTIGFEATQSTTIGFEDTQSTTIDNESTQNTSIDNEATQSTSIDNESTQSTTVGIEATPSTIIDIESTQSTTIDNEATQSTTIDNEAIQSTTIAIEATQSTTIDNEATQNTTMVIEATREAVSYLRNLTTPKNNSAAPNNLCPCRCDIVGIDFNPSPQILAGLIFKIQEELKVDTEQLSQKRNKKISAPDRRTGSQAMGYVGIVMVLIPVCLLVALDLTRLFTINTDT